MVVNPTGRPRFRFIRMSVVVDMAVGLGGVKSLAIGGAVSTEADITIGFSGLSLW